MVGGAVVAVVEGEAVAVVVDGEAVAVGGWGV